MLATIESPSDKTQAEAPSSDAEITLASGQRLSLKGLSRERLHGLQWREEQEFARAIMATPKDSTERRAVIGQAYDTICTILAAQAADAGKPLVMGLDRRYTRLVLKLLRLQSRSGHGQPRFFEVGYGCGALVAQVHSHGYPVAGIEVSAVMRQQAIELLGECRSRSLLLGDLRDVPLEGLAGRPTLVYWNDVLEHIPPDELGDYLEKIYQLLAPGGALVTITPHWLLRPSDVTGDFCPPRTEARGLHLKEYRLAEVTRLMRRAGFCRVATPLFATRQRLVLCSGGGCLVKQFIEPWLDRLPVRAAHLICRGLALNATIAWKGREEEE
jgi:SAM-dependent methyltransferase